MRIRIRGKKTQSGSALDSSSSPGNVLAKVIIFDNHQNRVSLRGGGGQWSVNVLCTTQPVIVMLRLAWLSPKPEESCSARGKYYLHWGRCFRCDLVSVGFSGTQAWSWEAPTEASPKQLTPSSTSSFTECFLIRCFSKSQPRKLNTSEK